jgi:anti-anti-sigma regulatory factor
VAGKLQIQVEQDGETSVAVLRGTIDEDAELAAGLRTLKARVRFDLGGVEAINSCGVREWINILRDLEARESRIEYVGVSVPLVQQFNMILNARGTGRVTSFHAPYFCGNCRKPREMLLTIADHPSLQKVESISAPLLACPTCGDPLEFDEIEEKFFNFLELQLRERKPRL